MITVIIATITFVAGLTLGLLIALARFIWLVLAEPEFSAFVAEAHRRFQRDLKEELKAEQTDPPETPEMPYIMAKRNGLPVMLQGTWEELSATLAKHGIVGEWKAGAFRWTSIDGASWEIQED